MLRLRKATEESQGHTSSFEFGRKHLDDISVAVSLRLILVVQEEVTLKTAGSNTGA